MPWHHELQIKKLLSDERNFSILLLFVGAPFQRVKVLQNWFCYVSFILQHLQSSHSGWLAIPIVAQLCTRSSFPSSYFESWTQSKDSSKFYLRLKVFAGKNGHFMFAFRPGSVCGLILAAPLHHSKYSNLHWIWKEGRTMKRTWYINKGTLYLSDISAV